MNTSDNDKKVEYEIIGENNTQPVAPQKTLADYISDPEAVKKMGAQLFYLQKLMVQNRRKKENARDLAGRVRRRRTKEKLAKKSRKRNRRK